MLFSSNKLVGLDIGTSTIKLVEVEGSGKKTSLTSFGYVPTPSGSVVAGEIVNVEAVSGAISELLKQTKTKRKRAAVGICGSAVIIKKISIPSIEENLLPEQLRWEAEQYIPFNINEINLSYHILRNNPISQGQMSLLLIGAKRDFIMKYAEAVEGAGLSCALVDVSGFALGNCYEFNYGSNPQQTVVLLCMGASMTQFIVIEHGEVAFCRDLAIGGMTYTSDLQKSMGISFEEAEALKVSAGMGQPVPQEVTESIKQTNDSVAEELRRSFDFYVATSTDANIQKVYVTGGGFGTPGLTELIGSSLGVAVSSLNPFQNLKYDSRTFTSEFIAQISPYISVGLGLALRQG